MKRIFFLIGIICITFSVSLAQNKKAEKEAAAKAQYEKAVAAIEAKDFVIIVDSYEADNGIIETNTDVANFMSFESDFMFMQGAIVAGNEYTNKLSVSDFKKVVDKKGTVKIEMQCKGSFVTAKVEISMKSGGNYANVIITPLSGNAVSQKKGDTGSQSKGEVLTSRGTEAALPSVGEAYTASQRGTSSRNGGARQFSGEIVPRAESKYFKRPGVV